MHQRECCLQQPCPRGPLKKCVFFSIDPAALCYPWNCCTNCNETNIDSSPPVHFTHPVFVYFLLFISQFALITTANSGVFPTWCTDRACLTSVFVVSSVAFVIHHLLCVWLRGTQLRRTEHDLQTTATEGKQQSTVELPQSCQEELIFLFSSFSMGLLLLMSELCEESQTDMFILHLRRQASSRAPNNHGLHSSFFSFTVGRGREILMRWEERYMKTPGVFWPIKNVHFLTIIRGKNCVWVCTCDVVVVVMVMCGGICKGMDVRVFERQIQL